MLKDAQPVDVNVGDTFDGTDGYLEGSMTPGGIPDYPIEPIARA